MTEEVIIEESIEQTFYIGQTFETEYPPEAAIWCNENNATIEAVEDGGFRIVEIPLTPLTNEDIDKLRELYYREHCDPLTCEKIRKTALFKWTEVEEEEYVKVMKEIDVRVEQLYPYIGEI